MRTLLDPWAPRPARPPPALPLPLLLLLPAPLVLHALQALLLAPRKFWHTRSQHPPFLQPRRFYFSEAVCYFAHARRQLLC